MSEEGIILKGARGFKTRVKDSAIGIIVKNRDNISSATVTGDATK